MVAGIGGCQESVPPPAIGLTDVTPILQDRGEVDAARWFGRDALAYADESGVVWREALDGERRTIRLGKPNDNNHGIANLRLAADPQGRVLVATDLVGDTRKVLMWDSSGRELSQGELELSAVSSLAVDGAAERLAIGDAGVEVFDLRTHRLLSQGDGDGASSYGLISFARDRVIAFADAERLHVWDVSAREARLIEQQNCRCSGSWPVVMDDSTSRAVISTTPGQLLLWDIELGRSIANRTVIASFNQRAQALAVMGDVVLFSTSQMTAEGRHYDGSLQAWNTVDGTVTTLWECPGCHVGKVTPRAVGDNRILIEGRGEKWEPGRDGSLRQSTWFWIATLRRELVPQP
jgi:WD40 repeat protein